jgi:hypothetical protein
VTSLPLSICASPSRSLARFSLSVFRALARTRSRSPRLSTNVQVGAFEAEGDDIIDEALTYYRANVLFRNYELQVYAAEHA